MVLTKNTTNKTTLRLYKRHKVEFLYGLLFTSPAILGFLVFTLGPMIASLVLSFTDYAIVKKAIFVGFDNYEKLFSGRDPFFYKSLLVTTYYVVLSVPVTVIAAFFIAVLLNQSIKGKAIFRTIFYLPTIVPLVASSVVWMLVLNPDLGLLNTVLDIFGLPTSQWIYGENSVVPSLAIMNIWTSGGMMVIFLAGLQGIPSHLYEAVEVDGGSAFQKMIHITIPLMTPTIFFNAIMGLITSFQVFAKAYIMTEGGPNNASLFYILYLYREAFEFSKMGYANAIAWVLFIIIMMLTILTFRSSSFWVHYEGKESAK